MNRPTLHPARPTVIASMVTLAAAGVLPDVRWEPGANLSGAMVTGANFNNVTWSDTTCPDGTNSNADGGACAGHLQTRNS
jgi:hypothetical protein